MLSYRLEFSRSRLVRRRYMRGAPRRREGARHGRAHAAIRPPAAADAGEARGRRRAARDFHEIYREFDRRAGGQRSPAAAASAACRSAQVHCPLHNNIPDWLKLTAEGRLEEAYEVSQRHQQLPGDLRPHLPAGPAVRRQLRHREGLRERHHRRGRALHHRHRLGAGLGEADPAARGARRSRSASSAPGPAAWPRPSSCAGAAIRCTSTTATTASAAC